MPDQTSNGMQCNEFDLLLTDAIDGVLTGTGLERFQAHARICTACGPLLAEAEAGRDWLKGLTEVEPPASLVNNILASTTGVDTQRLRATARVQPRISWLEHLQASLFEPIWAIVRQPRFAMSFRHGILRAVGGPDRCRSETRRPGPDQSAAVRDPAYVLQHPGQGRALLRKHPVRLRSGAFARQVKRNIAPAEPSRKNRAGQTERRQERHNTTARAEAGAQLQPDQQPSNSGLRSAGPICP